MLSVIFLLCSVVILYFGKIVPCVKLQTSCLLSHSSTLAEFFVGLAPLQFNCVGEEIFYKRVKMLNNKTKSIILMMLLQNYNGRTPVPTPGGAAIKYFLSSSLTKEPNKLVRSFLARLF